MKSAQLQTLSLNLLKTFCVFAEIGKVEGAAQRLRITQASVSLQLKKIEDETGQILFKTVGRKKVLTSFARDLFQSIAPPLRELEDRLKEVSKIKILPEQRIVRIGCRQEIIKRVSRLIHFPGQIQLSGMSNEKALTALKNDEIDIAIIPNPPAGGDWNIKKLFIDQPVLIANPKILKSCTWESVGKQLFKSPAIAYKKPAPFLNEVVENLGGKSKDVKINLFCEDWLTIIDSVKCSDSWSVLPRRFKTETSGLTVVEIPQKVLKANVFYSVQHKNWSGTSIFNSEK